jgi:hypothetical protein
VRSPIAVRWSNGFSSSSFWFSTLLYNALLMWMWKHVNYYHAQVIIVYGVN